MEDHQRLIKINNELNKLNKIIQFTQSENHAVLQLLNHCQTSTPSSSSSLIPDHKSNSHSLSEMFDGTQSKHTVYLPENHWTDSFDFNQCSSIIKHKSKKSSKKISNIFQESNFSTETIKVPEAQKIQTKSASTGIKKTKLQKSNMPKSKNKFLEKEKTTAEQQKSAKILRIKSEKKLLANNKSALKYSLNLNTILQQRTTGLKKQKLSKNTYQTTQQIENVQLQKTYGSTKMETLNSKRSKAKHNSLANKDKFPHQMTTMRNSNHKYQIELQKEVHTKIKGLKLKKTLCEVEGNYLQMAMKLTKDQIEKALVSQNQCSEENMIRFFILKTIMKFVFQIKDPTALKFEPLILNEIKNQKTIKKCQKFMKTINKLPEILTKTQQISEFSYKELTEQKLFIEQKISNLTTTQSLTKEILFSFLQELCEFISFLLKNNFIVLSKNGDTTTMFNEGFYSDRSAKRDAGNGAKENDIFVSKNKQFSQRKREKTVALKRANTAKALKKSTTAVKQRLI